MIIVPPNRTPMGPEAAKAALVDAFPSIDRETAALLLALIWIETRQGSSVVQHNPGNLSASERYQGKAWRPPWFAIDESSSERMKRLHQMMLEHKAPSAFRAYDSFRE